MGIYETCFKILFMVYIHRYKKIKILNLDVDNSLEVYKKYNVLHILYQLNPRSQSSTCVSDRDYL